EQSEVSIVMPTYNRGATVGRAIESVLRQTHEEWELLIVDDGSSDDTVAIARSYASDPRITLLEQEHAGVSAARNLGLRHARGSLMFYLDSDNRWSHKYLQAMVAYLNLTGRESGYSAISLEDDTGTVIGYRGEPFRWNACLRGNYVDLNAFCHTRRLYETLGGFDEGLRRMVDWDLILRYSKSHRPAYAPFVGCHYSNSASDASRISVSQPIAYRSVVRTKNRLGTDDRTAIAKRLRLKFAIKIAAPYEKRHEWGDYHFADSLKSALEALGHVVDIDFRGHWYDRPVKHDHVVIVLRGLTAYEPRLGHVNLMWNISHPDQVSYDEYDAYDRVYVASPSFPALLAQVVKAPVAALLQCADPDRFGLLEGSDSGAEVLFVGNSRNQFRPMVRWAGEAGLELVVHGTRWAQYIGADRVRSEHVDNRELARHYAGSSVVLNDHWESMRDFGFISNRVFDVLCCGGSLISDRMPAIDAVFGPAVTQVDGPVELAAAVGRLRTGAADRTGRAQMAARVAADHSFDARANVICDDVLDHLGLPAVHQAGAAAASTEPARPRVGILMQLSRLGPTSTGFIRGIAPLSSDAAQARLRMCVLDGVEDPRLDDCDVCIVQRVAVADLEHAVLLLERLKRRGAALVVDTDDAFSLLPQSHAEWGAYQARDAALRYLMRHADQVWFSTAALKRVYAEDAPAGLVVGNDLDPRIWRDYRKPAAAPLRGGVVRMLYMGTFTHDSDFALIVPALDQLHRDHAGAFEVTLVGAVRAPPARPWLKVLNPTSKDFAYPRFARWLSQQGPFDAGLAPLEDTAFNACKSDVKFLDYSALGLVSILSEVPAYSGDARTEELAVLVENSTGHWHRALEDLVLRRHDYQATAQRASRYLWERRSTTCGRLAGRVLALLAARGD
ncbi:MAG: glycosyltransferase, partial [Proteobacteria bacterium]|nr:glycosyltransferase [Pseudomonadota bacterium]